MVLRIKKTIGIDGMTCTQCEKAIQRALLSVQGVSEVTASFKSTSATIVYDSLMTNETEVHQAICNAGYEVSEAIPSSKKNRGHDRDAVPTFEKRKPGTLSPLQLAGVGILLIALYLLVDRTVGFNFIPQVKASMGYGMLFVVGLLTSLHCIAMCGGINLSQCLVRKPDGTAQAEWKPSLLYNGGRVLSYTLVGGVVGALGSVISFSGYARGIVAILAGLFMVVMGINMLGLVPALRRFQIHMPAGIRNTLMGKSGERGPFVVGLLNGLMPCGPLQAMQLYALGTGSAIAGALSMLVFSVGTVPLMFGFGAISTLLSRKFTRSILRFSAILVVVLGVIMMQRGFSLGGMQVFGLSSFSQPSFAQSSSAQPSSAQPSSTQSSLAQPSSAISSASASSTVGAPKTSGDVQIVKGEVQSNAYPAITVKKGVPVRFNLHVDAGSLNGCNGTVLIPEFNIQKDLQPGDNILSFTPLKAGQIGYTCWMGMISSTITVTD